jgi:DNA-binding MarR family transcriptional regulator
VTGTTVGVSTANLGFVLAKASQRFNELLLERFAAAGFAEVRASYGSVLVPLFEAGQLRAGEIAIRSRLSKQAVTGLLNQCEADGLLTRSADPADGRAFLVTLTRKGQRFQRVAAAALEELHERVVSRLGSDQHDALMEALKGVMEL